MRCSVPTERYPAQSGVIRWGRRPAPVRTAAGLPAAVPGGRAGDGGYPAGVSSDEATPRPSRLTAAAAVCAAEGLALVVGGLFMLVMGVAGDPDSSSAAETGGVTLALLGVIPLAASRGLLLRRAWSRGPAIITQLIALIPAWTLLRATGVLIPLGILLAAVAVAGLVLLVNPATAQALGIGAAGARGGDSSV